MELYAYGCSNTYGENLPDREHSNWSYFLGQHMGAVEVHNKGVCGASNEKILRNLLSTNFTELESPFVVIMWSYADRAEIVDESGEFINFTPCHVDGLPVAKHYYMHLHNYTYDDWRTYNNIHHAQCFLKSNDIPYFMTFVCNDDYDFDESGYFSNLFDYDHIMNVSGANLYAFSRNYPKLPCGHTVSEVHKITANAMFDWLRVKEYYKLAVDQ